VLDAVVERTKSVVWDKLLTCESKPTIENVAALMVSPSAIAEVSKRKNPLIIPSKFGELQLLASIKEFSSPASASLALCPDPALRLANDSQPPATFLDIPSTLVDSGSGLG